MSALDDKPGGKSVGCGWCGAPFPDRQTGGKPQQFCRPACRRNLDAALRAWARKQWVAGRVPKLILEATLDERARCSG